ncbi:MAG: aspartate aminotransferase family protein [Pseudomonadota bacterium]
MTDAVMATYRRLPVCFERGEGAWLWDEQGLQYLDAISGIAVCGLGHAHPRVREAICLQAGTLLHTSNLYQVSWQNRLADRLVSLTGMTRAFFCNSGAEANEAAIKLARVWGHRKGVEIPAIAVMESSFHGRTLATLSATGNRRVQAGFEPLVQGFVRVPYGDLMALRKTGQNQSDIVAVLVEPIQGEGGIRIPPPDYLAGLRALCDEFKWLLMLDEIQTGMGRTGRFLACQHSGVVPDVVTLAKGLGNGVPIGACLAGGEAADLLGPGMHASTFGGNPLACRVAHTVLEVMETDDLQHRAKLLGERLLAGFRESLAGVAGVKEIRGLGLMIGIELDRPCADLVTQALGAGLLINVTADTLVRLLPPLILKDSEADGLVLKLSALIRDFLDRQ